MTQASPVLVDCRRVSVCHSYTSAGNSSGACVCLPRNFPGRPRFMKFRPCIDLHHGKVVQIVGGSLSDSESASLRTNFVAEQGAADFAGLYRRHDLDGGHVIALGPGNEVAARTALAAWPGGMQFGGGVNPEN